MASAVCRVCPGIQGIGQLSPANGNQRQRQAGKADFLTSSSLASALLSSGKETKMINGCLNGLLPVLCPGGTSAFFENTGCEAEVVPAGQGRTGAHGGCSTEGSRGHSSAPTAALEESSARLRRRSEAHSSPEAPPSVEQRDGSGPPDRSPTGLSQQHLCCHLLPRRKRGRSASLMWPWLSQQCLATCSPLPLARLQ